MLFDGTLIGSTPAKTLGAGSGSDKNAAWNIAITVSKPQQDKILEPIDFVCQYNNWLDDQGNPYSFWFKNYYTQMKNELTPKMRNPTAP